MDNKEQVRMMRKTNMRIFPTYKKLAWDYLFFYTIDFLFLTQIKGISAADVMLKSTFYAFFGIILQLPANVIVEFLGRKNSVVLGNVLNCMYMAIIMMSGSLFDLIIAEFFSSVSFAIKNVAEPSLLNESIPPSRYKSQIYSKISAKGASGYYALNAISKVVAGALFVINGYLPVILSLIFLIIVTILSIGFIEPIQKKKKGNVLEIYKTEIQNVKDGFTFILKSERLKALILCASLIYALLSILQTYHVSLQEDIGLSSFMIGIIAAIGGLVASYASKKQAQFHNKFRNRSLYVICMILSITTMLSGIFGIGAEQYIILLAFIVLLFLAYDFGMGMFHTIIDKYLRNFANEKIDTIIFAAYNLFRNVFRMLAGLVASFLLDKMTTAYCMIIIGILFTIIYFLLGKYMKTRVGLKPEEYSKEERKYDELENEGKEEGSYGK